jgi:hypothetical protein
VQLEKYKENDPALNGFLIGYPVDLHAERALPLIQATVELDNTDEPFIDCHNVLTGIGDYH